MSSSDSDEAGGQCKYCEKSCNSLNTFLRHVSHSKFCKSSYDQAYLDKLKKKSLVLSQRKFRKKQSKAQKKERYQRERSLRLENAKKRYVPMSTKQTPNGRSFEALFKMIFDMVKTEKEEEIAKIAKNVDYIEMIVINDTLDKVFKEDVDSYYENVEEESAEGEGLEKYLDEAFQTKYTEGKKTEQDTWQNTAMTQVMKNSYFNSLNKAFIQYYDEDFKKTFEDAKEVQMDQVFYNVSDDMEMVYGAPEERQEGYYRDICASMENEYYRNLQKTVQKLCQERGIQSKLMEFSNKLFNERMKRDDLLKEYL